MIPRSISSRPRPQFLQPRQHRQLIRQPPHNPPLRKPLPLQQQPRLTLVIPTTTRRPIERVTNTNSVNRRHTIPARTQPRRPPKLKPRHSITKPSRTVRPDNSNTRIRPGISTIPRRKRARLRVDHARERHSRLLLPRLLRRHPLYPCRMRASLVRPPSRQDNAPWQIRLRQRRPESRTSQPQVGRGQHLGQPQRATSPPPYLHTCGTS